MDGPLWLVTLERASCWSHGDGGGSWSPLMRNEAKEAGVASPGKNTRVGCHDLLQGIFLTQG